MGLKDLISFVFINPYVSLCTIGGDELSNLMSVAQSATQAGHVESEPTRMRLWTGTSSKSELPDGSGEEDVDGVSGGWPGDRWLTGVLEDARFRARLWW